MPGTVLFTANNGSGALFGLQPLFFSDGTAAGTNEISLTYDAGYKFFQARNFGTSVSPGLASPDTLALPGGKLLFLQEAINNATNGVEMLLGTSNGTAAGTSDFVFANTANNALGAEVAVLVNGKALLSSTETPQSGQQETVQFVLTDGTAAGTSTFSVLGPAGNVPAAFTDAVSNGTKAFFAGDGADGHKTLWVSDGTQAGTAPISAASISGAATSLSPSNLDVFGAGVLFNGADTHGAQGLWYSDGTAAGTVELASTVPDGISTDQVNPRDITTAGALAFFSGPFTSGGSGLWVTDGTAGGTHQLSVPSLKDSVSDLTSLGDRVVFSGQASNLSLLPYVSDGSSGGTFALSTVAQNPTDFTRVGGRVFFEATDASSHKALWATDGSVAGTLELQPPGADTSGIFGAGGFVVSGDIPINLVAAGNELYFEGLNNSGIVGLWESDGTSAGTVQVASDSSIHISGNGTIELAATLPGGGVLTDREDFTGDGRADILIQNTAGAVDAGELNSAGQMVFTTLAGLGPEWAFKGDGDFYGVGETGALIENAAGAVFTLQLPASGLPQFRQVTGLGSEWKFVGTGDYLGAGHDQFLIENGTGAVVVADAVSGSAAFTTVTGLGGEWTFRETGDFLGHAKSDFLIENTAGVVAVGEVSSGAVSYESVTALGPEWRFVGAGDFLDDGRDQFLIENTAGAVVAGEVGNSGGVTFTQLTALGPEWKFLGAGDFLADGHSQFLIENTAGAVLVGDDAAGQLHFTQVTALGPEWIFHS